MGTWLSVTGGSADTLGDPNSSKRRSSSEQGEPDGWDPSPSYRVLPVEVGVVDVLS